MVASPEDEIRLNNGFLEQLTMYYNATENIYLKLLRTKKWEKCPIVVSSFFWWNPKFPNFSNCDFCRKIWTRRLRTWFFIQKTYFFKTFFGDVLTVFTVWKVNCLYYSQIAWMILCFWQFCRKIGPTGSHFVFAVFQNARYSVVSGACYRKPSSKSKSPSAEK